MSAGSTGAACRPQGLADGLHDAAPVGVAAEEGRLDERRVGHGPRDAPRPRRASLAPSTVRRIVRVAPSPSATMATARRSRAGVSASPEHRQARRARASHPTLRWQRPIDGVVGRLLPVDRDAVERAVDGAAAAGRPVAGAARRRRWSRSTASWPCWGEIMPPPLAAKPRRTSPLGQVDVEGAVLGVRSVVRMAVANSRPPAADELARRLADAGARSSPWAAARR